MSQLTYYARKQLNLKSEIVNVIAATPSSFTVNGYAVASAGNVVNLQSQQALASLTITDDSSAAVTFSGSFSNTNPMLSVVGDTIVLAVGFAGALDVFVEADLSGQCNFRLECVQNPGSLSKGKVSVSSLANITTLTNRGFFHFPLFYSTPLVTAVNLSFVMAAKNTTVLADPQISNGLVLLRHVSVPV